MRVAAIVLALSGTAAVASSDELESGTTWEAVRERELSIVFGRLEGRFDGPEYRGRKIRIRNRGTGDERQIEVDPGRGYFEAALPVATYEILAIEATYFPPMRPMNPRRFPPVPQRYGLRPVQEQGLPSFPVVTEMPVYLGTIRSTVATAGLVYEGHQLQVLDEYDDAWARLCEKHPALAESLRERRVDPARYFFLKPTPVASPLVLDDGSNPLSRARGYIDEGKFRQATEWLETTVPLSDAERLESQLLLGEALLGDGKHAEALEELGEVLLAEPENLRALRLLARAHAFEGDAADALNLYQALATALPGDAEASLHVGYEHALRSEAEPAARAFDAAFESNFDYLLHDLTPYALALKAEDARYEPPHVIDGAVRLPANLRSRRSSRGAFGLLLDHRGKVLAAHLTPDAESWAPATLMSIVRARFRPARLNGVAIPCLVILGAEDVVESAR